MKALKKLLFILLVSFIWASQASSQPYYLTQGPLCSGATSVVLTADLGTSNAWYCQTTGPVTTGGDYLVQGNKLTIYNPSNKIGLIFYCVVFRPSPNYPAETNRVTLAYTGQVPSITSTTGAARCGSGSVTLGAATSAGTINWYSASSGGSSLGSGASYATPSLSSTATYYVDATANGCTSASRTAVIATIKPVPYISGVTPASRCGTGSVTLSASASAGTINWYSASSGGSSLGSGTSYVTPSLSSTTPYYMDATLDGCTSGRSSTLAMVNPSPVVYSVLGGGNYCAGGSGVSVGLSNSENSISYQLYVDGAATGSAQWGTGTSLSFGNQTTSGTYTVIATNTSFNCSATMTGSATITINALPTITGVTPASSCGAGSVTLGATASSGTINWYSASSGGSSLGTGTSYATPSLSSNTTYYVDATANGCTSASRTAVTATIKAVPNISGVTPASRCGTGSVTLSASASAGTINWYSASTGGSSLGSGTSYVTPSISSNTTYYMDATFDGCTSDRASSLATINSIPSIIGTTPASRCGTGSVTLSASASAGTINWYSTSSGGSSLGTGTSYATPSLSSTATYYVDATDNGCTSASRTAVTATIKPVPYISGVTSASRCGTGSVTLSASASAGTINWYSASSGGSSLGTGTSYVTPSISSNTTYYIDATLNGCTSSRSSVLAMVNPSPVVYSVSGGGSYCAGGTGVSVGLNNSENTISYQLYVDGAATGSAKWGTGTSLDFGNQTTSGTYTVIATNTSFSCTSTMYGSATVTVNSVPSITGVTPASRCGTGGVTLSASASAGTINWYSASSGGSSLGTGTSYATPSLSSTATYYVDATANGCTSVSRTPVIVTINPFPSAGTVSGHTDVCAGTSADISYSVSNLSNATGYVWSIPDGANKTYDNGTSIKVSYSSSAVSGNVSVYGTNGCGSGPASSKAVIVNKRPWGAQNITGPRTVTYNGTGFLVNYNVDPIPGATSYIWTLPSGMSLMSGTSTNSITARVDGQTINGTLTVRGFGGACGAGPGCSIPINPPASKDKNYVRTRIPLTEYQNSIPETTDPAQVSTQYTYMDGLGRPIQGVQVKASPQMNDVVAHIEYDEFGRRKYDYLPYSRTSNNGAFVDNAKMEIVNYYGANLGDGHPYAEKVFDQSPLSRVVEQGAPGTPWQAGSGHTIRMEYGTNEANDVYYWTCDETNHVPVTMASQTYYNANSLIRTKVFDENAHWTEEYKDNEGNVVLRRKTDGTSVLNTYYVYDKYGLLRYVLPPAVTITSTAGGSTVSQTDLNNYCYSYTYDYKKRMVCKKLPGADSVLMVYDKRNRLVATQNGVQRDKADANAREWSFVKYDKMNRTILSGTFTYSQNRIALQCIVNADTTFYEERTSATGNHYYTDQSFPGSSYAKTYLNVNYYDDYDVNNDDAADYAYTSDTEFAGNQATDRLLGLATVCKTRQLDPSTGAEVWFTSAVYYDKYYRAIQGQTNGIQGGTILVTNAYNFVGMLLKSKQGQTVVQGSTVLTTTIRTRNEYDHAGRVLNTYHKVNNSPEVNLANVQYNELGQVITKKLHVTSGTALQKLDYTYNIRGWLKKINEPDLSGTDNDLFGMELMYNEGLATLNGTAQYNGNISGVRWKSNVSGAVQKAYGYTYDPVNRLLNAKYGEGSASDQNMDRYNESATYDNMGNIFTLNRKGLTGANTFGDLDVLTYAYNGNQLKAVGDAVPDAIGRGDFYDFTDGNATQEYSYDKNGNMWVDRNKHMKTAYNLLNLPSRISDTINTTLKTEYVYSASGQKLKQRLSTGSTLLYNGNMIYTLDGTSHGIVLQYIITPEGRVINVSGTYTYEYNITDQLGNTRVSFSASSGTAVVVQQTDYYPFGLAQKPQAPNNDNKYLYNGKELQDDMALNLYDYGARMYEPAIGKWTTLDPMAEQGRRWSPYTYCFNNPVRFIDPDGMWGNDGNGSYDAGGVYHFYDEGKSLDQLKWEEYQSNEQERMAELQQNYENLIAAGQLIKDAWNMVATQHKFEVEDGKLKIGLDNSAFDWMSKEAKRDILYATAGDPTAITLSRAVAAAAEADAPLIIIEGVTVMGAAAFGTVAVLTLPLAGDTPIPRVHANSKDSPKPNIVYEIYKYNSELGTSQIMKYGISSQADFIMRTGNPRPEYQVIGFNSVEPKGSPYVYSYTILARTPDRATALALEKALVERYIAINGKRPPLQIRP